MRVPLRTAVSVLLCSTLSIAHLPAAFAQTDEERAGARAAADAGLKAFSAGRFGECADLFSRAESLVHAPPHLLYVARCSEKLGRLVKAREAYLKITKEIIAADKPKPFHDAKKSAEKELAAIEPRIAYLNVKLAGVTASGPVTITMDGVLVPAALVGVPRPVDPGEHQLLASADGLRAKPVTITLKEGQSDSVTIELAIDPTAKPTTVPTTTDPVRVPPATLTPTGSEPTHTTTPPSADKPGDSSLRTIGWITGGVGLVGLIVGGVFFAQGVGKSNDADAKFSQYSCGRLCTPGQQQEVTDLDNQGSSAKTLAWITGGVGLAALGLGITLIVIGGPKSTEAGKQGLRVEPVFGPASIGLRGVF